MSGKVPIKFIAAAVVILGTVGWLSLSGIDKTKQYYVTINELNAMGNKAYTRNLRVAGNVAPGTIQRVGPNASFVLVEQGNHLRVDYQGSEPPPDTFKDDAQALAIGTYGRDGVFHATQLQAKCASKYAPQQPGAPPVQPGPPPAQSENTSAVGPTAMLAPSK
jgi:cytochrome c-type biogenesis protein CcmE